jgi:hypothetical protein
MGQRVTRMMRGRLTSVNRTTYTEDAAHHLIEANVDDEGSG